MSHHWLILTFSWLGTVSPQYINTGGPAAETVLDPLDSTLHYPFPYVHYFNLQPSRIDEPYQGEMQSYNQFYQHEEKDQPPDLQRKRRTAQEGEEERTRRWLPNLVDTDQTEYLKNDENMLPSPFILGFSGSVEDNATDIMSILDPKEKKNFSPWGGKRSKASVEHMWSWKRSANIREPNMPKRVRFSPWGGKRSGQMILKPGAKGSKLIFSTTVPELTRIVSNFSPNAKSFDLTGYQFIPSLDKRHPIKILALSTKLDEKTLREALPFRTFLESLPKIFKPGHPYVDVNLKKDGKRKVKFSAWGGKRSPPIIGPIWTPAPQDVKESTLNTILLLRNNHDNDETTKAF